MLIAGSNKLLLVRSLEINKTCKGVDTHLILCTTSSVCVLVIYQIVRVGVLDDFISIAHGCTIAQDLGSCFSQEI